MSSKEVNIRNKRARFEYHLLETYTAGIQLGGTEIKSIRNSKASILEAYCICDKGEVWIRTQRFELDGDTLTAIGYAGGQTVRQRCPK